MFMEVKKMAKIFSRYFRLNLACQFEYRISFLVNILGMILSNVSFIFFWWLAFDVAGYNVAGNSFKDVMFLWAVTSSGFGISHILFSNIHQLSCLIMTGELDTYLLQPIPVLFNVMVSGTLVTAYGDLLYGIVLLAIVWGFRARVWLIFILAVIISALVITSVNIIAHTLTFYLGNSSMITGKALDFIITFSVYPEGIFKGSIKTVMFSILPAAFVSHLPLRLVNDFNLRTLFIWLLASLFYFVLSCFFFTRGVKKYESGNLIVTRM